MDCASSEDLIKTPDSYRRRFVHFKAWTFLVVWTCNGGTKGDYYKTSPLEDECKNCVFETTWGWVTDDSFHFCLHYPFNKWWGVCRIRRRSSIEPAPEIFSDPPDDCALEWSSCESHPGQFRSCSSWTLLWPSLLSICDQTRSVFCGWIGAGLCKPPEPSVSAETEHSTTWKHARLQHLHVATHTRRVLCCWSMFKRNTSLSAASSFKTLRSVALRPAVSERAQTALLWNSSWFIFHSWLKALW